MKSNNGIVTAVHKSPSHTFSKYSCETIRLIKGEGVNGDAHCGKTVKHRSRVKKNPNQPNLRQIHLINTELFDELADQGFPVKPGNLGENISTTGIDLLNLPTYTHLRIGSEVLIELTGLRNPCPQIDDFMPGLLSAVLFKDNKGNTIRKCGVMGIILVGGNVNKGDEIEVQLPSKPYKPLVRV